VEVNPVWHSGTLKGANGGFYIFPPVQGEIVSKTALHTEYRAFTSEEIQAGIVPGWANAAFQ
jgi:hypothetical protein